MAGILDKKSRVIDLVITPEGRKQMHNGNYNPRYASFTDNQAFYESDPVSGSSDATERIYFESFSLPIDQITYETDDSGMLMGFNPGGNLVVFGDGGLYETVSDSEMANHPVSSHFVLMGSASFAAQSARLMSGSIENLKKMQLLRSVDLDKPISELFTTNTNLINYRISNSVPFGTHPENKTISLNSAEPIIYDKRLAHEQNYKFLPPKTKSGLPLASYRNLEQQGYEKFSDLTDEIGQMPKDDVVDVREAIFRDRKITRPSTIQSMTEVDNVIRGTYQSRLVKFDNTTIENNMMGQIFEVNNLGSNKKLLKLDIVDRGVFDDENDPLRPKKHVFFVGKVMTDSYGINSFINLFTLIFD